MEMKRMKRGEKERAEVDKGKRNREDRAQKHPASIPA